MLASNGHSYGPHYIGQVRRISVRIFLVLLAFAFVFYVLTARDISARRQMRSLPLSRVTFVASRVCKYSLSERTDVRSALLSSVETMQNSIYVELPVSAKQAANYCPPAGAWIKLKPKVLTNAFKN